MFGLILYSVLTFMAAASMLVFLEECVYVYKKVPANKKSVIIWVNGAAPVRVERRFTLKEDLHHLFPDCIYWWSWCVCTFSAPSHKISFLQFSSFFFLSRWLPPCPVWGCGFPDPPCLLTWPRPGGFLRLHLSLTFHRSLCSVFWYQGAAALPAKRVNHTAET